MVSRQTRGIGDDDIRNELRLQLKNVSSSAAVLPAPARNLNGEVHVLDGVATFEHVRGRMAGSRFVCSKGSASKGPDGNVFRATVQADDFPVDERMANLMTGPLRETYLKRDVRGKLKIDELEFEFLFPEDGGGFESTFSGSFVAKNIGMTIGTRVSDISGLWRIDRGIVDSNGGHVWGSVEKGAMTIMNHRMTGIHGTFEADPIRIVFDDIGSRLHNGRVTGAGGDDDDDVTYELGGEGRLEFHLRWEGISLIQMLRASRVGGDQYRGNLGGEFHLTDLVGLDFVEAEGHGHLRITDGRLGEVPIFRAIYSYLSATRRPRFDSLELNLTVGNRRILVRDLEVTSPLLTVTGSGTLDMDGYVNMLLDFPDFFAKAGDWLVLPQLLHFLTNSVVGFEIYGFLRSPQAKPRWLWSDQPGRSRLQPIPAHRPRSSNLGS